VSRAAHPESVGARRLPRGIVRRVGWSLADQVVSSGTNFAVGLILARSLSIEDFGAFSLAFFIYAFAISLARAYPLDPLLIRYSVASPEKWRRGAAAAVGTSTGVACVAAIGLIAVGVLVGGPMGAALLALGATLPGLLTQDAWRVAFFAAGRARSAFINDVVWALFLVPAFALAGLAGASLFAIMLAWGLAASIAALFGVAQTRVVPRPDHALAWWREHDDLAARFLLETGLRTGLGQLVMIAIGAIAGLAAIGSIRAAQLVMAPVQVLYLGASMAATPEAVRALDKSLGALLRMGAGASLGLALACLTWGGIALLIPDELGRLVLRDTWDAARIYLPASIVAQLGTVLIIGPGTSLRAFANARLSLKVTALTSVFGVGLPVIGASMGGLGAAWGLALASLVGAAIWWLALPSGIRTWQRAEASPRATLV